MPKFSENEKVIIREKLFSEGEQLFIRYGVRKVTIDDLVKAVGIAKGSFYAFYANKEHLYVDILRSIQKKMLAETDNIFERNPALSSKELVKKIILWSYEEAERYPMLLQQDAETMDYLTRKLPKEVLDEHIHDGMQTPKKFMEYGARFKYDAETVAKVFRALTVSCLSLLNQDEVDNKAVIEILVSGAVNEIVRDDNEKSLQE